MNTDTADKNKKSSVPVTTPPGIQPATSVSPAPMSDIELAVKYSRYLEFLLEKRLGATGTGLHEKVTSVEKRLGEPLVKRLRWIATLRNKVVHEEGFALPNAAEYQAVCKKCTEELQAIKVPAPTPPESPAARAARLQAQDRAYVKWWFLLVGGTAGGGAAAAAALYVYGLTTFGYFSVVLIFVIIASLGGLWGLHFPLILFDWRIWWYPVRYLWTGDAGPLAATIREWAALNRGAYVQPTRQTYNPTARTSSGSAISRVDEPWHPPTDDDFLAAAGNTADVQAPLVNPATGLPLIPDSLVDAGGNPFGSDIVSASIWESSPSDSFGQDIGGGFGHSSDSF